MNQNKRFILKAITSLMAFALTTACSSGLSSSSSGKANGNGVQSTGPGGGGGGPATNSWNMVSSAVNSSVSGGPMNQFPLIHIDPMAETIELLIPFSVGLGGITPILPGSVSIANAQGVTIGPVTLPDGSSGWAVTVPLKYLLQKNGAGLQPLATLPNGQPLPYFPSAEIDGVAITLPAQPKYQVTLYIALKAVAVFVSVPGVNLPIGLGYNLVNQDQTRNIGYVALIPTSGNFSAGVYVAAQLPTDVSLALNSLVSF